MLALLLVRLLDLSRFPLSFEVDSFTPCRKYFRDVSLVGVWQPTRTHPSQWLPVTNFSPEMMNNEATCAIIHARMPHHAHRGHLSSERLRWSWNQTLKLKATGLSSTYNLNMCWQFIIIDLCELDMSCYCGSRWKPHDMFRIGPILNKAYRIF